MQHYTLTRSTTEPGKRDMFDGHRVLLRTRSLHVRCTQVANSVQRTSSIQEHIGVIMTVVTRSAFAPEALRSACANARNQARLT